MKSILTPLAEIAESIARKFGMAGRASTGRQRTANSEVTLRADIPYFHVTHPKAGSQWVQALFLELFNESVICNKPRNASLTESAVTPGRLYTSLYLTRKRFEEAVTTPNFRYVFVMRDLRDTFTSLYFSLSGSHRITSSWPCGGTVSQVFPKTRASAC